MNTIDGKVLRSGPGRGKSTEYVNNRNKIVTGGMDPTANREPGSSVSLVMEMLSWQGKKQERSLEG